MVVYLFNHEALTLITKFHKQKRKYLFFNLNKDFSCINEISVEKFRFNVGVIKCVIFSRLKYIFITYLMADWLESMYFTRNTSLRRQLPSRLTHYRKSLRNLPHGKTFPCNQTVQLVRVLLNFQFFFLTANIDVTYRAHNVNIPVDRHQQITQKTSIC